MTVRRGMIALVLAGLAVVLTAGPALAHTTLRSSNPANGATLTAPPTRVSLTFGEAVAVPGNPIRITGPGGVAWTVGKASVTDATVSAPVTATGPAGAYTLAWTVIADDGDTINGNLTFTVRGAAPAPRPAPVVPAPAPATSPAAAPTTSAPTTTESAVTTTVPTPVPAAAQTADAGGGVPWWVWVVGAAVVLAGVGGAVAARGRRSGQ